MVDERVPGDAAEYPAPEAPPQGPAPTTQRRDLESLSPEEVARFRRAISRLQAASDARSYDALAGIYGSPHLLGQHHTPLFLAWHRAFLLHFELALQAIDPGVALPWWDIASPATRSTGIPPAFSVAQVDGVPNPLYSVVLPPNARDNPDPTTGSRQRTWRQPGNPADLPTDTEFAAVMLVEDFAEFQTGLETLHDRVHAWIGGALGEAPLSAYDPLFYPMHVFFDRLFWVWQSRNPAERVPVTPAPLPPFDLTFADVVDVRELGYTYDDGPTPGDSSDAAVLAGYRPDTVNGQDLLGVSHDVAALCCVLTAKSIEPPISVGLFGEWGSGKSFFMEQMRSWIRQASALSLAAEADGRPTLLCSSVKQVTFNAWHYTDANLWASLVVRLFEGLAEPDTEDLAGEQAAEATKAAEEARDKLFQRLPLYKEQLEIATRQHDAAVSDHERAKQELEDITQQLNDAKQQLEVAGTLDEQAIAATADEVVRQGVDAIRDALPVQLDQSLAALQSLDRDLSFTGVRVRMAFGLAWQLPRTRRFLVAAGVVSFLLAGFGVWVLATGRVAGILALYAAVAPLALAGLTSVRDALGRVQKWATKTADVIRTAEQRQLDERRRQVESIAQEERGLQLDVQRLALEESAKMAEVDTAKAALAGIGSDIRDLAPGKRLSTFIEQRTVGSDYAKYLGVIALIPRDFEELDRLMRSARLAANGGDGSDLPRIDRIVLYIDDLDRVPAQRVVEVLQAVHLLLAIPLFVVVVAVDPRWLLKSLQHHYAAMLAGAEAGDTGDETNVWTAHSFNYLEKIFQIPYTLDPMETTGYERLIRSLMATAPVVTAPTEADAVQEREKGSVGNEPVLSTSEARAAVEASRHWAAEYDITPRGLEIDEREVAFMARLAPMIATPRGAKRLANTYRLIRASIRGPELTAFLGSDSDGGDYRAVLVLLGVLVGYPNEAPKVFAHIRDDEKGTWPDVVAAIRGHHQKSDSDGVSDGGAEVSQQLADHLEALSDAAGPDGSLAPFQRRLFDVARYSFQTGRAMMADPARAAPTAVSPGP